MAASRTLSKEVIDGFDKYKYSSVDTSPLSRYVMHPFWDWIVQFCPLWVAPNVLTLTGSLMLFFNFFLMTFFDMSFYASSRDHLDSPAVPNWIWIVCGVLNFLSHTLDGIDGKQARRTKTSSPVGELFDHGLDSWASFLIPVAMYSAFGRGESGVNVYRVYIVLIGINVCFIISHWEKYITGVLFLPWGYDIGMLGVSLVSIITGLLGYEFWKFTLFGYTAAECFEICCHVGFFGLTFPFSFYNVAKSYINKTGKMLSLTEATRPLVSTSLLIGLMLVWVHYSSYDILEKYPRLFYWATGTAFSNIASRLIIAQMSSTRCELINWLLVPLMSIVAVVCFLDLGALELYMLIGYNVFITVSHLSFGVHVVQEMCDHFKIKAFSITRPAVNGNSPQKQNDIRKQKKK